MAAGAPRILVLGGCGFIGRNFVEHLVDNKLASFIRVADKVLPDLAGLSAKQLGIYKEHVEFVQANLARPQMAEKAFDGGFDIVVNLAGETKLSQTTEVYKENIVDIASTCIGKAKEKNIGFWVEMSTSQVYDSGSKPSNEGAKIKPWTKLATARLQAEEVVKASGVPHCILRPSNVYGPGDKYSVTPRVLCSAVYQKLDEKFELLWDKDLHYNTVHVRDVARAIFHVGTTKPNGQTFNLNDSGETTQGTISDILGPLFGIKTGFLGGLKSKAATTMAMSKVCEMVNDKHLQPWSDLCKEKGILNTPLTPYLDEELLYKNPLSIDGTAITKTGFAYQVPAMTPALIKETIDYVVALNFFPPGLLKA